MSHFDEQSGIVPMLTKWGRWWQTIDEIFIEVDVENGINSKEIKCMFTARRIKVTVENNTIIEGDVFEKINADEAIWTLEDKRLLCICLPKCLATAEHCWKSLLVGEYEADDWTYDQMQKKMTLQRFQYENPGMDFSGAEISGNYQDGGPKLER